MLLATGRGASTLPVPTLYTCLSSSAISALHQSALSLQSITDPYDRRAIVMASAATCQHSLVTLDNGQESVTWGKEPEQCGGGIISPDVTTTDTAIETMHSVLSPFLSLANDTDPSVRRSLLLLMLEAVKTLPRLLLPVSWGVTRLYQWCQLDLETKTNEQHSTALTSLSSIVSTMLLLLQDSHTQVVKTAIIVFATIFTTSLRLITDLQRWCRVLTTSKQNALSLALETSAPTLPPIALTLWTAMSQGKEICLNYLSSSSLTLQMHAYKFMERMVLSYSMPRGVVGGGNRYWDFSLNIMKNMDIATIAGIPLTSLESEAEQTVLTLTQQLTSLLSPSSSVQIGTWNGHSVPLLTVLVSTLATICRRRSQFISVCLPLIIDTHAAAGVICRNRSQRSSLSTTLRVVLTQLLTEQTKQIIHEQLVEDVMGVLAYLGVSNQWLSSIAGGSIGEKRLIDGDTSTSKRLKIDPTIKDITTSSTIPPPLPVYPVEKRYLLPAALADQLNQPRVQRYKANDIADMTIYYLNRSNMPGSQWTGAIDRFILQLKEIPSSMTAALEVAVRMMPDGSEIDDAIAREEELKLIRRRNETLNTGDIVQRPLQSTMSAPVQKPPPARLLTLSSDVCYATAYSAYKRMITYHPVLSPPEVMILRRMKAVALGEDSGTTSMSGVGNEDDDDAHVTLLPTTTPGGDHIDTSMAALSLQLCSIPLCESSGVTSVARTTYVYGVTAASVRCALLVRLAVLRGPESSESKTLAENIRLDDTNRISVCLLWLCHTFASCHSDVSLRIDEGPYGYVLMLVLNALKECLDERDMMFSVVLLFAPVVTDAALQRIHEYCTNVDVDDDDTIDDLHDEQDGKESEIGSSGRGSRLPPRVTVGLQTFRTLLLARPPLRSRCLQAVLSYASDPNPKVRQLAIRLVTVSLFHVHALTGPIVAYAELLVENFVKLSLTSNNIAVVSTVDTTDIQNGDSNSNINCNDNDNGDITQVNETKPSVDGMPQSFIDKDCVERHLSLLSQLCTKRIDLISKLFSAFIQLPMDDPSSSGGTSIDMEHYRVYYLANGSPRSLYAAEVASLVKRLGASSSVLLKIIETPTLPVVSLVWQVVSVLCVGNLTGKSDLISAVKAGALVIGKQRFVEKSKDTVSMESSLTVSPDAYYMIPILSVCTKNEIVQILPSLIGLPSEIVRSAIGQLMRLPPTTAPLSAVDLLLALHTIPIDVVSSPLAKAVKNAIEICLVTKLVFIKQVIPVVVEKLLQLPTVPTLFMLTVIKALHGKAISRGFALDICLRLVKVNVWSQDGNGGTIWQGVEHCLSKTLPDSVDVLLHIPPNQLAKVICGTVLAPVAEQVRNIIRAKIADGGNVSGATLQSLDMAATEKS